MTEVMLMADVKNLGKAGAIVNVAPGYARNMLIPQGLAAPVTEAAKRRLVKLEAQRAAERKARKAAAEALAAKLSGLSVTVRAQVKEAAEGEVSEELYGSVGVTALLDAIEADRGVKLERAQINLPDQLNKIGTYEAKIDLGEGVTAPLTVFIQDAAKA